MFRFIVRRLLITIPTILVVISITWVLIKLAPGNFYSGEKPLSPAVQKNIREKYGLDKPWYQQYGKTMWGIIRHLDSDVSEVPRPVGKYNHQALVPVSAAVGLLAYLLALIVGVTVGSIAALKQNSKWDYGSMALRDARYLSAELCAWSNPGPDLFAWSLLVTAVSLGRLSESQLVLPV